MIVTVIQICLSKLGIMLSNLVQDTPFLFLYIEYMPTNQHLKYTWKGLLMLMQVTQYISKYLKVTVLL